MKVVFATHPGFVGCLTAVRHTAAVLGGEAIALDAGAPVPACDLLVLSSWHEDYDAILSALPPTTAVAGRWHSPLLQTELSGDLWKLERLLALVEEGRYVALTCDDRETAVALGLARDGVVWSPNVLDEREYRGVDPAPPPGPGVHVVLPGEPYPRKNLAVQAAGFELARDGADWTLHLLGQTRRRPELGRWLETTGVPYVDHGFLERRDYLRFVAAADAGLAASLTESWGYAAGDFLLLGVPVVVSPAVTAVTGVPELVADSESPEAVAAALRGALAGGEGLARDAAERMRARAAEHADVARRACAALLRAASR